MRSLILLTIVTLAYASVYELPIVKTVVVKHVATDLHEDLHDDIILSPKTYHSHPIQTLHHHHPVLSGFYPLPVKKYTVQYPKGLYHGPHGLGIYNPKLHDALEQAYYRG